MGLEIKNIKDSIGKSIFVCSQTTEIALLFTDRQLTTCFCARLSTERLARVARGTDLNSSSQDIELNLSEVCHHHQQHEPLCKAIWRIVRTSEKILATPWSVNLPLIFTIFVNV